MSELTDAIRKHPDQTWRSARGPVLTVFGIGQVGALVMLAVNQGLLAFVLAELGFAIFCAYLIQELDCYVQWRSNLLDVVESEHEQGQEGKNVASTT